MAIMVVAALHVVSLPPAFWQLLPGRNQLIEADGILGLSQVWRPLALVPNNGWNALASLITPLAVLLLAIQLDRECLYRLMPLIAGLGAISGLFGLLQVVGSPNGPLYFYQNTNNGSAVGLFANRNHAAVLLACLFPMLAVVASRSVGTADQQKRRQLMVASIAVVLVPLVLVTGSRSGLLTALAGLVGATLLYRQPIPDRKARRRDAGIKIPILLIIGGVAVGCLGFLTFFFSRATAIERLFLRSVLEDERIDSWSESVELLFRYFPWGSGSGSFAGAYRIAELPRLLDSTYLNHTHNDWIEVFATMGLPGLLLVAAMGLIYLQRTFVLWFHMDGRRQSVGVSRAASLIIAMIATASFFDYPLRTPIMMCVFVVCVLWLAEATRNTTTGRRSKRQTVESHGDASSAPELSAIP